MFYKWGNQGLEKFRLSPRTTARTWQPQDANPHLSPPEFLLVTQLATLLEFAQSLVQSRPGPDHFIVQREMGRYPSHPRRWGGGDWTPAGPAPLLGGDIAPLAAAQQPAPRPAAGMAARPLAWPPSFPPGMKKASRWQGLQPGASLGGEASVAAPIVPAESVLIVLSKAGLRSLARGQLWTLSQQARCPLRSCQLNGPRRNGPIWTGGGRALSHAS